MPLLAHSKYLKLICGDIPIKAEVYKQFNNFFFKAFISNNKFVKICCKLALHGSGSAVSSNINVLTETFQYDRSTVWARSSVFNTVIDKYVENIYIP